jgi:proton-translocating NADH-quinone oxidoreductase chain N
MVNLANPILLVGIPLFFAFLIAVLSPLSKKSAKYMPIIAFGLNLTVAIALIPPVLKDGAVIATTAGIKPPFAINMAVDRLGLFLVIIASLLGFLVSIYNTVYIKEEPSEKFYMLFTLLITGVTWMIITGDMFNLFVAFEVTSISAFGLVGFHRDKGSVEAGFKYLVLGSIGTSLLLIGVIMLYASTGTLNMADIAQKLLSFNFEQKLLPYAFIFTGLGIEGALFPLNAWLPDAHPAAPSSVSAILSGIMTTAAIYGIIRVTVTVFNYYQVVIFLILFGLLTLIFGETAAFFQKDIKRMLAFSTIGQTGLFFYAFALGSTAGMQGAFMQMMNHSISKAMLFLLVGGIILQVGSRNIEDFAGVGRKMKISAFFFAIAAFSLMGLPPFFGFWSKLQIIFATLRGVNIFSITFVVIVLFMSLIEGAYFFRVLQIMFFRKPKEGKEIKEAPGWMLTAVVVLGIILLVMSFYPKPIMNFAQKAATDLVSRNVYINAVLHLGGL